MATKQTWKAWGGFSGGQLFTFEADLGWGGYGQNKHAVPSLFWRRKDAREQFQDVRPVIITLAPKGKAKK